MTAGPFCYNSPVPHALKPSSLLPKLSKFEGAPILVIGDLMVDRFLRGPVHRLSPEAPVPVVDIQEDRSMPGGAGNVASNIAALAGRVDVLSVVGNDADGDELVSSLGARGIDVNGIIRDASRPTIVKTRVIAGHQQVVRFDRESRDPLAPEILSQMLKELKRRLPGVKGVIVSDYGKGVVSSSFLKALLPLAKRLGKFVTVDPKIEHFQRYKGVDCITPNLKEATEGMRAFPPKTDAEVDALGASILKKLKCRTVLVTRSERGMSLYESNGKTTHIPSQAKEVFDVTGAGDTVISVFSLALAAGCTYPEAAYISNAAAGVVVAKLGTATCSPKELARAVREAMPL
jgi:D-glycero-beta-D-manno-heptose-7-phosphate kinase